MKPTGKTHSWEQKGATTRNSTATPSPIDFVVTWVDGSDPAWQAERDKWLPLEGEHPWSDWATGDRRFRDWGLLRYWFRGVEAFAPWVNKIHFVTWGHVPEWLNLEHPKLNVVRHEDFIPKQYLPTFSSRAIELNLHRIKGLSEQFVYFNDDMFITRPARPDQFFRNGLPRDFAGFDIVIPTISRTNAKPINASILNAHFDKYKVLHAHPLKWFNFRYDIKTLIRTALTLPYRRFTGMQFNHLACNLLKSTFDEVWSSAGNELDATCRQRFRGLSGCNIWIMQDWVRAKGEFEPGPVQRGAWLDARLMRDRNNADILEKEIVSGHWSQVSVNDECTNEEDFAFWSSTAKRAFQQLLPDASSFETT